MKLPVSPQRLKPLERLKLTPDSIIKFQVPPTDIWFVDVKFFLNVTVPLSEKNKLCMAFS